MTSFVAATSAVSSGGTVSSLAPAYASTTSGHLLVIVAAIGGQSTFVDPTGFTAFSTLNGGLPQIDSGTTLRAKAWYRWADGSETGTVTVSWTGGAQQAEVIMLAYKDVDTTTPFDFGLAAATSVSGSNENTGTSTGGTRSGLEVIVWADRQTTGVQSFTPFNATLTERVDTGNPDTPFLGITAEEIGSSPVGSNSLPQRTAIAARSNATAAVYFRFILTNKVTAQTDLQSYGSAGPSLEGFTDPRVTNDLATKVWPDQGLGWPSPKRRKAS